MLDPKKPEGAQEAQKPGILEAPKNSQKRPIFDDFEKPLKTPFLMCYKHRQCCGNNDAIMNNMMYITFNNIENHQKHQKAQKPQKP
jgi:hypothetical protein